MKSIDVVPCSGEKRHIAIPHIPLFRYTPTLGEELEGGLLSSEEAVTLFRAMLLQRNFEYMVRDLDNKRFVPHEGYEFRGTTHLSVGQEATAMGAMSVLSRADYITSNHRGHGHCIGKGLFALYGMSDQELEEFLAIAGDNQFPAEGYENLLEAAVDYHLYRTMAELLGKEAGYCRGRGGGMHIADFSVGNLGANAIVGGSLGIATGAAFSVQYLEEERIVLCCIGDGAMNNGIAHEAMNFAVMDQFQIKRCVLGGESQGGVIALMAVMRQPDRFEGLVLVDASNPNPEPLTDMQKQFITGLRTNYPTTIKAFVDDCIPEPNSEHFRRWALNICLRVDPAVAARLAEIKQEDKFNLTPSDIPIPTLIIHGSIDIISPLKHSEYLASIIPNSELVVIEGAGHVPIITRPHEVVNAIERHFPLLE